jgi:hypothetical protein
VEEVNNMKWQIIVLLLLVIACAKPAAEHVAEKEPAVALAEKEAAPEPMTKSEAVDISMAMKLGKPMKCVSVQEGQTATIYMKGSQMRMDTMPADAHGIYTQDVMYTWSNNQGMMIKMEDVKNMAGEQSPYKQPSQEDVVANAQRYNTQCETAIVDESMFTPPADIKFQDMGEMLKQAEAAMKGLKK